MHDFNVPHTDWASVCSDPDKEAKFIDTSNDGALEELAMELARKEVTADLILNCAKMCACC